MAGLLLLALTAANTWPEGVWVFQVAPAVVPPAHYDCTATGVDKEHLRLLSLYAGQVQSVHPPKPQGLLQSLQVPPYPFHVVTSDHITGLPRTQNGYNATAVSVCKLTRCVYAVLCTDKTNAADRANIYVLAWGTA